MLSVPSEQAPDVPERGDVESQDLLALQAEPLDLEVLVRWVSGPAFGAVAMFGGTVRDTFQGRPVDHLEYEAYAPMAVGVLRGIASDLRGRFEIGRIAIVHRTGRLEIGETSVAVAVSAPHRRAALDACSEAIELVKRTLPVWKKEVFADGEVWRENDVRSGASPGDMPETR